MSWQVTVSGHHDDPEVEGKAKAAAQAFVGSIRGADLGMTDAHFSGGTLTADLMVAEVADQPAMPEAGVSDESGSEA